MSVFVVFGRVCLCLVLLSASLLACLLALLLPLLLCAPAPPSVFARAAAVLSSFPCLSYVLFSVCPCCLLLLPSAALPLSVCLSCSVCVCVCLCWQRQGWSFLLFNFFQDSTNLRVGLNVRGNGLQFPSSAVPLAPGQFCGCMRSLEPSGVTFRCLSLSD